MMNQITMSKLQERLREAGILMSNATINNFRAKYLKEGIDYNIANFNLILYTPTGVEKIFRRYEYLSGK